MGVGGGSEHGAQGGVNYRRPGLNLCEARAQRAARILSDHGPLNTAVGGEVSTPKRVCEGFEEPPEADIDAGEPKLL